MESTLLLGLAAGYHYGDVRPFAASLEQSGFRGDCVLFITPTTRGADRIAAHGVTTVPFERSAEKAHIPYNAWRYVLYRDWLANAPRRYSRILLTDVRDVIFQADPMAYAWGPGVNVTLEDACTSVGTCPYMTKWVTGHLGDAAWRAMAQCRVSCSGTTVAAHGPMLDYLDRMIAHLKGYVPQKGMAGYDQGVHNHLLHTGQLPEVTCHDNSGPILTLAMKPSAPAIDAEGRILNDNGDPAVIVHQYDRKPDLFATLRQRYAQ